MQNIQFLYHPLLPSRYRLKEVIQNSYECEILVIEGSIDPTLKINGVKMIDVITRYSSIAEVVITAGTCSTFGGIFSRSNEKASGLHFREEKRTEDFKNIWQKSISLPGCPVHPDLIFKTIQMILKGLYIDLDECRRPKIFYGWTVHDGCNRNEYYEYKIGHHRFGEMEGCMFIDHGCRAPFTRGSCNKILWNGINSKTRAGQPCSGCTEPDFPAFNLWETKKHMGIPAHAPLGVPKRAYISIAGVAKAFKIERFEKRILKKGSAVEKKH
ncbi:MAG: hydrogenase [Hydrogenimonas sp.]|nr:hydrogenase [Hydrogenimonas sp.]